MITRGFILTVLYYIFRVIQIKLYRAYHSLPNGPIGISIFGVAFQQFFLGDFVWYQKVGKYGKLVSYQNLQKTFFLINDPSIARKLYNIPCLANRYEPYLSNVSNTITFLNGPKWKLRRKNIHTNLLTIINSQFVIEGSTKFLKNIMFPCLDNKYIKTNKGKIDILLSDLFRPITFNLVLYACTGNHIESLTESFWMEYNNEAYRFWAVWKKRIANALLFGEDNEKMAKRLTSMSEIIRINMVNLVKKHIEINGYKNNSFYSKMVDDETNDISNDEIIADISSLLLPSIDTTSNTAAFAVLCLCKYPNIQNKLFDEISSVFNTMDDINLSPKYLSKLIYFRSFIHEILRLYPAAPATALHFFKDWENEENDHIKLDNIDGYDYYLKKGYIFYINTMSISRNKEYWIHDYNNKYFDNKHQYIDMNKINFHFWIDNDHKFRYNKSLSTFGFGIRECVGKQVAIKNLYVIISSLLLNYKFCVENTDFKFKLIQKPLLMPDIVPITIEKRQ